MPNLAVCHHCLPGWLRDGFCSTRFPMFLLFYVEAAISSLVGERASALTRRRHKQLSVRTSFEHLLRLRRLDAARRPACRFSMNY